MAVTLFPRDRGKLCAPGFEQRFSLGIDGAAFFGADHMRLDPLTGDAADVRECLGVDQGHQPVKGIGLALVRRGRQQQEIWCGLCESLAQLETSHLVGAAAKTVRLVHDDEVPAGRDQVLEPLAVVFAYLGGAPPTALVQGLERVHGDDHLREHLPGIGGQAIRRGMIPLRPRLPDRLTGQSVAMS